MRVFPVLRGGGRGAPIPVSLASRADMLGPGYRPGAFEATFTPEAAGMLSLDVLVGGAHVSGSPLSLTAEAGPTDAGRCLVRGEGLESISLRGVATTRTFFVEARDQFDNPRGTGGDKLEARLVPHGGCDSDALPVPVRVQDRGDGTYDCAYTLAKAGAYKLEVLLGTDPAGGSPFDLAISADPAELVRRQMAEQERRLQREREAAQQRKEAEASRRAADAAARAAADAVKQQREAQQQEENEKARAVAVVAAAAEAAAAEEERRRRVAERLRREEAARRKALDADEEKRRTALEAIQAAERRHRRPDSAGRRAGGGFVLSFKIDGSGNSRRQAWAE